MTTTILFDIEGIEQIKKRRIKMPKFKVNYIEYGKPSSMMLDATNEYDAFDEMFDMASEGIFGVTEKSDPWLEEIEGE